jgi:hypothetical protein
LTPTLALITAFGLLLAGCGGGDDSEPEQARFDPERGEALAHAALIQASDLPGSGWQVTANDEKEVDDQSPDTESCKQVKQYQNDVKADEAKARVARAQREIARAVQGAALPTGVEIEIEVYEDSALIKNHLERASGMVDNGVYSKCLTDLMDEVYRSGGLTGTTKTVSASAAAPRDGFAFAAEGEVSGVPISLRFENYGWLDGNAKIRVSVSGTKAEVTPELVKATLEKTQAALDNAAASN